MAVTAKMVSELRDKTGAAMMDCKKALEASGGDMDAALDHLRKQGLKTAAKKAGRETSEGRVSASIADDGTSGALVAVRDGEFDLVLMDVQMPEINGLEATEVIRATEADDEHRIPIILADLLPDE